MLHRNENNFHSLRWQTGEDDGTNNNKDTEREIISKDLVSQMRELDAVLKREVDFLDIKPATARGDDYSVNRELTKLDLSQALLHQELDSCAVPRLTSCSSSLSSSSVSSSSPFPDFDAETDCRDFPNGKDDLSTLCTSKTTTTTTATTTSPYTSSMDTENIYTTASQIQSRRLQLRLRLRLLVFSLLILISVLVMFMLALAVATPLWGALVWIILNYGS